MRILCGISSQSNHTGHVGWFATRRLIGLNQFVSDNQGIRSYNEF